MNFSLFDLTRCAQARQTWSDFIHIFLSPAKSEKHCLCSVVFISKQCQYTLNDRRHSHAHRSTTCRTRSKWLGGQWGVQVAFYAQTNKGKVWGFDVVLMRTPLCSVNAIDNNNGEFPLHAVTIPNPTKEVRSEWEIGNGHALIHHTTCMVFVLVSDFCCWCRWVAAKTLDFTN